MSYPDPNCNCEDCQRARTHVGSADCGCDDCKRAASHVNLMNCSCEDCQRARTHVDSTSCSCEACKPSTTLISPTGSESPPSLNSFPSPSTSVTSMSSAPPSREEDLKLILFFDGTGNTFSGSSADTNVIKLLGKLDRNQANQFHYYQTGIGTYGVNEASVDKSWVGELRSTLRMTVDQAFGTTFDSHVLAGYRFLMRYYNPGAKIYMFGFSRGAFTARFLARMISTVGLLCKGNEEMIPFAYQLYRRYLIVRIQDHKDAQGDLRAYLKETFPNLYLRLSPGLSIVCDWVKLVAGSTKNDSSQGSSTDKPQEDEKHQMTNPGRSDKSRGAFEEIKSFGRTFCRKEQRNGEDVKIKVFFLGLWDCVSSVSLLDLKSPIPMPSKDTAHHVRHAVAVDERRVKFKALLFCQDYLDNVKSVAKNEDVKEVWFPGAHGDVGGGWPAPGEEHGEKGGPVMQLSDIPLAWMITELQSIKDSTLIWSSDTEKFLKDVETQFDEAANTDIHDSLSIRCGGIFNIPTCFIWRLMEFFPLIRRFELHDKSKQWKITHFPLNKGGTRSIPRSAVLHHSLKHRLEINERYSPKNNHGTGSAPCLKKDVESLEHEGGEGMHMTYRFNYDAKQRVCGGFFYYPKILSWVYAAVIGFISSSGVVLFALAYYCLTRYTNFEFKHLTEKGAREFALLDQMLHQ